MPRVAEARAAAEPSSADQRARHRRIIRAAERLGADKGLDGMQMHDVAKEAGVAIATLYRYFPSKTHLFSSVMAAQVEKMGSTVRRPGPGDDPVDAVAGVLVEASRGMMRRPKLSMAMIQSNLAAQSQSATDAMRIELTFLDMLLAALGAQEPTAEDMMLLRLVEQCWYGVIMSALNGRTSLDEAEQEIRLACRLLLGHRWKPLPVAP